MENRGQAENWGQTTVSSAHDSPFAKDRHSLIVVCLGFPSDKLRWRGYMKVYGVGLMEENHI
jgi:hypothetical protein